jgi:hypothetical protein
MVLLEEGPEGQEDRQEGLEELEQDRRQRDPVSPAQASGSARRKESEHRTTAGQVVHSFRTLLAHLGTCCRNRCVTGIPKVAMPQLLFAA